MNRHTTLMITLVLSLVMAQAFAASAQQTAAQAAEQARQAAADQARMQVLAAASKQIDAQAIAEIARKAEAQVREAAALSALSWTIPFDLQVADAQAKLAQDVQTRGLFPGYATGEAAERMNYDRGVSALDSGKWQAAVDAFDRVIKTGGQKADGASYWKAYAQNRLGQRSEALATLDGLLKKSPNSRWAGDAKALQVEVRQLVGQPAKPEQETDEELKLLAIRGLLNTEAERALPMLETLLQGSASPKLKDQALFVLGMSESPKAREILVGVARGRGNPDLQLKAIKYLGYRNAEQNRPLLVEIYKSTIDIDVKRRVIEALTGSVSGPFVFTVGDNYLARGDYDNLVVRSMGQAKKPTAATAAVQDDLWALYQAESEVQLKKQMMQAMAMAQSDKILELARTEKNLELRQAAIQDLGLMKSPKTSELLLSLYKDEKDPGLKKAIVRGLYMQRNAPALVQIARQETDPAVKRDVVEKLSTMKDKEAVDYLIELLKK